MNKTDSKKIALAFFILLSCLISMIVINVSMIMNNNTQTKIGISKNDSIHRVTSAEHKIIMAKEDSIISQLKTYQK